MTLPIIKLWDSNEFMLKQKCAKIEKDQISIYKDQIEEMAKFVNNPENDAVWLALPQIGILRKWFVMRMPDGKILAALNPTIIDTGHEFYPQQERCLSEPNVNKVVVRAEVITLKFMDLNGETVRSRFVWFPARVIQHEIDHLNGILLVDK